METLDDFLDGVLTQDVKRRFTVHTQLVSYLSDPMSSLKSDDLDRFVDGLAGWVKHSNYKVSVNGLEVLCLMVDRMGEEFKPHITTVLPSVIDRLGDAKDQVRDQTQQLLLKLMMPASSPQYVFERMSGAFTHKLWHVREGVLVCLQNTINRYGARSLHLSKTVPAICKLLDDQNSQVREAAVVTLTEIYRHVGEKVRVDLGRKGIPAQKLSQIYARFDDVKMSGNMLPTADVVRQKTTVGASRTMTGLTAPERTSRTRSRIGVSQSQPGSRSTSPSSRGSYLTHTGAGRDPMTPKTRRKSGIPRSQGASRETSPNRHAYGRERRLSGGKVGLMSQRVLRPGTDVEDALHDALSRPLRKRYDVYDSDDAASETSSLCSERSFTSYSGRTSEDMSEIIGLLGSGSYTERKEGLASLLHLLRSGRYLSRVELKKVTEIFTRMFHDPHSKVFSMFLDTLSELCLVHARDLTDWLYVMLTRLLNKTGSDMLTSVNAKLLRTLDTVRDTFPCDSQFNTVTKFVIDQTQSPNLKQKVKTSMMNYLQGLIAVMDPSDFVNTMDTRLAVSRIINWTMEPRNTEVRKSAQLVLIGLFNLNSSEFSLMLAALPKAFQDGATKVLHSHMRAASDAGSDVLSPRNVTSPTAGLQRSRPPSRQSVGQPEECETENMNPEDIYNSIKKTSADIQNLSLGSKLDGYEDIKKKRDFASQDSGIQELRTDSPDGVEHRRGNLHQAYNPQLYQEESGVNGFSKAALSQEGDTGQDKEVSMADILRELSHHNERMQERRQMLDVLLKWVRNNDISVEQWDEHFKSILLILIETFNDTDEMMRMNALIVLRSILKRQAPRFKDYAELTILKVCEAHKDPSKHVQRAAEECALVIPTAINPAQALAILNNIIATATFPIHWAAIKIQVEVVKLVPNDLLLQSLPDTVPGLLMGYDDSDSRVRKAAVFCLVNIYMQVGEGIRPYLMGLNSSKTKLLNLYIKRAQEDSRSGIMSPAASDT